jgi:hypothetical protein
MLAVHYPPSPSPSIRSNLRLIPSLGGDGRSWVELAIGGGSRWDGVANR